MNKVHFYPEIKYFWDTRLKTFLNPINITSTQLVLRLVRESYKEVKKWDPKKGGTPSKGGTAWEPQMGGMKSNRNSESTVVSNYVDVSRGTNLKSGRPKSLTDERKQEILKIYYSRPISIRNLAKLFGVSRMTVWRCVNGT